MGKKFYRCKKCRRKCYHSTLMLKVPLCVDCYHKQLSPVEHDALPFDAAADRQDELADLSFLAMNFRALGDRGVE